MNARSVACGDMNPDEFAVGIAIEACGDGAPGERVNQASDRIDV